MENSTASRGTGQELGGLSRSICPELHPIVDTARASEAFILLCVLGSRLDSGARVRVSFAFRRVAPSAFWHPVREQRACCMRFALRTYEKRLYVSYGTYESYQHANHVPRQRPS